MNTTTISDFINDIREVPHGLVIVAGPKNSGKTNTMLLFEAAVSKMNRGRYFRIGSKPPVDGSVINFIESFKPNTEFLDEATDDEVIFEYNRWVEWDRAMKRRIMSFEPAGVFVDDLDKNATGLSSSVIDMALVGTLVIVAIEASSAESAVQRLSTAAKADFIPNSPLAFALHAVLFQNSTIDPATGDTVIEADVTAINDEFWSGL